MEAPSCVGWLPEGLPLKLYELDLSHNSLNGMAKAAPLLCQLQSHCK